MNATNDTLTDTKQIVCCGCGIGFYVPQAWEQERRRTHGGFYCPNGHSLVFRGETAEQQRVRELEAQLETEKKRVKEFADDYFVERKAREQVQRSLAATKGALTKTRKRIAGGVCPCCNRSFANLHRHMETKHPTYDESPA